MPFHEMITFGRETTYLGRNGEGRQLGLNISALGDTVYLEPINSKGDVARCAITLPLGDLEALVGAVTRLNASVRKTQTEQ